jgi:DnaJ-class molecular chaperone
MGSPADNYWPEPCGSCHGTGKYQINLEQMSAKRGISVAKQLPDRSASNCNVCGGKALVLVLQPAQKCRRCAGSGRWLGMRCVYCKGTGWMFVQREHAGFLR